MEGLLTYVYGNKNIIQRSECILDGYHIYDWFWSRTLCIVIFNVESLIYELVFSLFFNGWPFFQKNEACYCDVYCLCKVNLYHQKHVAT